MSEDLISTYVNVVLNQEIYDEISYICSSSN